jgi:hypothetical protein
MSGQDLTAAANPVGCLSSFALSAAVYSVSSNAGRQRQEKQIAAEKAMSYNNHSQLSGVGFYVGPAWSRPGCAGAG